MRPGSFFEVLGHYRAWKHVAFGRMPASCQGGGAASEAEAATVFGEFVLLCVCFGLAQGAVITAITYTTTFLGEGVGSYCDGFFFGTFTACSFLFADAVVAHLGRIGTYRLALVFFLAYQTSLWVASRPAVQGSGWASSVAFLGSSLGGVGFSLHWTSQSVIYRYTARTYAEHRGLGTDAVNDTFSGVFAAIYVPIEMLCKQAAALFIVLSAASTKSGEEEGSGSSSGGEVWSRLLLVFMLGVAVAFFFSCQLGAVEDPEDPEGCSSRGSHRPSLLGRGGDARAAEGHADKAAAELGEDTELTSLLGGLMGNPGGGGYQAGGLGCGGGGGGGGGGSNRSQRPQPEDGGGAFAGSPGRRRCEAVRSALVERLCVTPRMLCQNRVLLYLMPINAAFGTAAGFLFTYYYDQTVARYRGEGAVGAVSAVGSATCALAAIPLSLASSEFGKGPMVALGAASLGGIGALYLAFDVGRSPAGAKALGSWGGVVGVNILMGLGRAVWENTNKACYADLFSAEEAPRAFANMYMITGALTFTSLFVFPSLSVRTMALVVVAPALLMVPGYYRAVAVSKSERRIRSDLARKAAAAAAAAAASSRPPWDEEKARRQKSESDFSDYASVVTL